jgi:hypothetical protein
LNSLLRKLWDLLGSLKVTIVCLAALMVLVVGCTLAQTSMGLWGAVAVYMRSWIVWWRLPATAISLPIFPGGVLVGVVLLANLVVAQLRRLELSWRKSGLWVVHAGLILLFVGEFVTALYQNDTRLTFEIGQTVDYVESPREHELVLTDVTDPAADEVYGVPEGRLADQGTVQIPGTPVELRVKKYFANAQLGGRRPTDPPSMATAGIGPGIAIVELPPVASDEETNRVSAFVEPVAGGRSYGTWLVSNVLGAPQSFTHEGHTYTLAMRSRRWYLPYSVTLKEFHHDVYPGTQIPKNFASLVQLRDASRREDREVLIYMNQPLRYAGRAFYQASFGKGDTLSVLQVVENPGWLLPYISCVLVGLGLVIHFAIALRLSLRRRAALTEATT